MKNATLMYWAYPAIVVASWIAVAGFTLSDLATVAPSLGSIAAAQRPGALPADVEPHRTKHQAALASHLCGSHSAFTRQPFPNQEIARGKARR